MRRALWKLAPVARPQSVLRSRCGEGRFEPPPVRWCEQCSEGEATRMLGPPNKGIGR